MNRPTKNEMDLALGKERYPYFYDDHDELEISHDVIYRAYIEAIEALRDLRAQVKHPHTLLQRSDGKRVINHVDEIIEKAPEVKDD